MTWGQSYLLCFLVLWRPAAVCAVGACCTLLSISEARAYFGDIGATGAVLENIRIFATCKARLFRNVRQWTRSDIWCFVNTVEYLFVCHWGMSYLSYGTGVDSTVSHTWWGQAVRLQQGQDVKYEENSGRAILQSSIPLSSSWRCRCLSLLPNTVTEGWRCLRTTRLLQRLFLQICPVLWMYRNSVFFDENFAISIFAILRENGQICHKSLLYKTGVDIPTDQKVRPKSPIVTKYWYHIEELTTLQLSLTNNEFTQSHQFLFYSSFYSSHVSCGFCVSCIFKVTTTMELTMPKNRPKVEESDSNIQHNESPSSLQEL